MFNIHNNSKINSNLTTAADRRRQLAPRTSEEEALFIANKYALNKPILEAKLANSVSGGRAIRQAMLDEVAAELSAKYNVANRSRKYVEQKLRDMKKEARKFFYLSKNFKASENEENSLKNVLTASSSIPTRVPSEPIRVMMNAMGDDFKNNPQTWEDDLEFTNENNKIKLEENVEDPSESRYPLFSSTESANLEDFGNFDLISSNSKTNNNLIKIEPKIEQQFCGTTTLPSTPFDLWQTLLCQGIPSSKKLIDTNCHQEINKKIVAENLSDYNNSSANAALLMISSMFMRAENNNNNNNKINNTLNIIKEQQQQQQEEENNNNNYITKDSMKKTNLKKFDNKSKNLKKKKSFNLHNNNNNSTILNLNSKSSESKSTEIIEDPQYCSVNSRLNDETNESSSTTLTNPSSTLANKIRYKKMRKYRNRFKWITSSNNNKNIINNNKSLKSLKHNLLMEEINASKAFIELCQMIQKSVCQVSEKVLESYRLQDDLIKMQLKQFLN